MSVIDTLMPLVIGTIGIVLGSIINYFVLKKLIKGQVVQVLDIFEGTETGKEIADMIHRVSEWSKSESAEGLLGKFGEVIDRVNRFSDSEDAKELFNKVIKVLDDLIGDE